MKKATRYPINLVHGFTYDYELLFEYDKFLICQIKKLGAVWISSRKVWILKNYGGKKHGIESSLKSLGFKIKDFKPKTTVKMCSYCKEEVKIVVSDIMDMQAHHRECVELEKQLLTLRNKNHVKSINRSSK